MRPHCVEGNLLHFAFYDDAVVVTGAGAELFPELPFRRRGAPYGDLLYDGRFFWTMAVSGWDTSRSG